MDKKLSEGKTNNISVLTGDQYRGHRVLIASTPEERKEQFKDQFINGGSVLMDFMNSPALDGFEDELKPHFEDYFISSAIDPTYKFTHYAQLCYDVEHELIGINLDHESDSAELFDKRDIKAAARKYRDRLETSSHPEWKPENRSALKEAYEDAFENAETEIVKFMVNPYFTKNFPGLPNTNIFIRCYMASALDPENFDDHYEVLEQEYAHYNIDRYPSKHMMAELIDMRLEKLIPKDTEEHYAGFDDQEPDDHAAPHI